MTGMGGFPPTNSGGNKVFVAVNRANECRLTPWTCANIANSARAQYHDVHDIEIISSTKMVCVTRSCYW